MKWIVSLLLLNPLLSTIFLSFRRSIKEVTVSNLLIFTTIFQWILALSLTGLWFFKGAHPIEELFLTVYQHNDFSFDLYYLLLLLLY